MTRSAKLAALLVLSLVMLAAAARPANAYATTGCRWGSSVVRIDTRYVNGYFFTAIKEAIANYSNSTDLTVSYEDNAGPNFTARNASYGYTGWEGLNTTSCFLGTMWTSDAKLNMAYLAGATSSEIPRLRVVWLHELGHGFGLGHVASSSRVMYTSASSAYFNGVRYLTSDEINGINSIY